MRKMLATVAVGSFTAFVAASVIADERPQQVRVEASRIVTKQAGQSFDGVPITDISLSYEVSLDDLNLASTAGMSAAEKRINNAAEAACKEISRDRPNATPADATCADKAARAAMIKLREAMAAAAKTTGR
jgi:UrcA family protein